MRLPTFIRTFLTRTRVFYEHNEDILNFYNNWASNAETEYFDSEFKLFRNNIREGRDKSFFLFKKTKLYA